MQINLVLREKELSFAEGSSCYWIVTDNDDYVLHIDIDEQRTAMFAVFVRDRTAIKCTIDAEGYVLNKNGERKVPMWALTAPVMTVGVITDNFASKWCEIPVKWSVKRLYEEEVVQPDDPIVDQLMRMMNDVVAPTIEVETNVGSTYTLRLTDKNGTIITPNLRGDIGEALHFDDLTEEEKASLKGDRGEKGETGATGAPFTYDMFTAAQLEALRGQQGIQGEPGKPFKVAKTYGSIAEMNLDFDNPDIDEGSFVLISSNEQDPDNAKLFVKGENAYGYITDLSGAQGIQGDQGVQGIQGERGLPGVGVSTAAVNASGRLIITKTDYSTVDAGYVIGERGERGLTGDAGISVVDAGINASGHLILALSNNTTVDAGYAVGTKGDDGNDGSDGVGVKSAAVDASGNLVLTLTDDSTVTAGHVVGADGAAGETGETGADGVGIESAEVDSDGDLILTLTDGTEVNAGHVVGADGATGGRGVGISGASVDANHHLILTLTNSETVDAGYVRGDVGATGIGVSSAAVNASNHLIITLTNGNTVDAGYVKGDTGGDGQDGEDGADGKSAYEVAVDNGFVGNESAWLASLVGQTGAAGVGISSASIDSNYHLILTKTDGNTVDAGYARGATGATGAPGADYVLTNQDKSDIATLTLALLTAAEGVSY